MLSKRLIRSISNAVDLVFMKMAFHPPIHNRVGGIFMGYINILSILKIALKLLYKLWNSIVGQFSRLKFPTVSHIIFYF